MKWPTDKAIASTAKKRLEQHRYSLALWKSGHRAASSKESEDAIKDELETMIRELEAVLKDAGFTK